MLSRRNFLSAITLAPLLPATLPAFGSQWPAPSLWKLPNHLGAVAWTVDDGVSYETVSKYVDFIESSGIRLTFFVTSKYESWIKVHERLLPLVESGQVQLANHTVTHHSLTQMTAAEVQKELVGCHKFLADYYGVDAKPYFRPPYGRINETVIKAAADVGYTRPVLWLGSLGDATPISAKDELRLAEKWMLEDHIVIGHANQPTVTHLFPQIKSIIDSRHLKTVTLHDVFG